MLGPIVVQSYTLLLSLGVLGALVVFFLRAKKRVARPERWLDAVLLALAAGVLGARLGYVSAHWDYYQAHSGQILQFWLGGLSWHGGLLGVLLALVPYCRLRGLSFWRLADELALVAPLVAVAASLGCSAAGCAYGRELASPHLLAADLPDLFGVLALRYNVQWLAAGWSAIAGAALWLLPRQRPRGAAAGLFFVLFGAGLGNLDSMRGDAVPYWWDWRGDVVLDWLLAAGGAAVLAVSLWRGERGVK